MENCAPKAGGYVTEEDLEWEQERRRVHQEVEKRSGEIHRHYGRWPGRGGHSSWQGGVQVSAEERQDGMGTFNIKIDPPGKIYTVDPYVDIEETSLWVPESPETHNRWPRMNVSTCMKTLFLPS